MAGEGLPAAAPSSGKVGGVAEQPVATLGRNRVERERGMLGEKALSHSLYLYLAHSRSRARDRTWLLPLPPLPLTHLQDGAVVEVVGAGPALQRGEGHIAACER